MKHVNHNDDVANIDSTLTFSIKQHTTGTFCIQVTTVIISWQLVYSFYYWFID